MLHSQPHSLANKRVKINPKMELHDSSKELIIEDWWDRVAGKSWMHCSGNPAALHYAARSAAGQLPTDDEVVYGKAPDGARLGHIIHISELGEVVHEQEGSAVGG